MWAHPASTQREKTQARRIAERLYGALEHTFAPFAGVRIALCISGGVDSRALLEAVASWPHRRHFDFVALSVNHNTRPESAAECARVKARAQILGLKAEILSVFCAKGDEASLREARYNALWHYAKTKGINHLCTAHQKDDNAEGVVMDLFGFGGGAGGAGMPREALGAEGMLLRPFIALERRDLLLFLSTRGAPDYFEDPSNSDASSARQKARDFLRQQAGVLHPTPVKRLAYVAAQRSEDGQVAYLRENLKERYASLCPERDPRDARPAIDAIVEKAKTLGLIKVRGVDPSADSIKLRGDFRLSFDLPGATALMTRGELSLIRKS